MSQLDFTGERLVPGVYGKIAVEHLHRYASTVDLVKGKRVLDIASGEGYGSNLLAKYADEIIGVDISEEAISHACSTYKKSNLKFKQGSVLEIPFLENSFDVVVSFETLEHVLDHEKTMSEVKRILKPDGILIISTPEKSIYSDQVSYSNPFHEKELYEQEFRDLIKRYFNFNQIFFQKYVRGSLMVSSELPKDPFKFFTGNFQGFNLNANFQQEYMVAVCSNIPLPQSFNDSLFSDTSGEKLLIEEIVSKRILKIKSGLRYRLIDLVFKPWDLLKTIIK
jgi:ubiquinone/menaquinone biosynthesis C-methylase UbiE